MDIYIYLRRKISLRCENTKNCRILLTLKNNELHKKLKGKIQSFQYILNKKHKCNGFNEIKKETNEVQSESDLIKGAKTIIIQNKEKI